MGYRIPPPPPKKKKKKKKKIHQCHGLTMAICILSMGDGMTVIYSP